MGSDPTSVFTPGIYMHAADRAKRGQVAERDEEFYFLSFRLHDNFVEQYRNRVPAWGFPVGGNVTLGEINWLTKYSARKLDGSKERFWEGLRRAIEGMYSIQKDHALRYRLPWDENTAHTSAQEAYERCFSGKWSPPGRGFWKMGTFFVNGLGDAAALLNCAFISTEHLDEDPTFPFTRLMEMSMLGIGVGFDTLGAGKVKLCQPKENERAPFVVPDSREGWCDSVGLLLKSYFMPRRQTVTFDYSEVRGRGELIKSFGGRAAGPEPLQQLHQRLRRLLDYRQGERITSSDIVDIQNMVGKCVVAANVRSSAEIALGSAGDLAYINLKNPVLNPERMGYLAGPNGPRTGADGAWLESPEGGWGYTSNNSVVVETGGKYDAHVLAERIAENGEPGLVWLDVCRKYGRLIDPPTNKDYRVAGVNPCGEQPLEHNECCTLVETYPTNCKGLEDYLRTLKFAYLYGKTVTLLPTHWPETNEVMMRNRRIGTSMSGLAQFVEGQGWAELRRWQDAGYKEIRRLDVQFSEWLGVRESIKVTTIKPSGTVSLLFGVTPGAHWPTERGEYFRRLRLTSNDPVASALQQAGFLVETNVQNPQFGLVVTCPTRGPDVPSEREVSLYVKVLLAAQCQEWWSDNAVSITASFLNPDERSQISAVLQAFDGKLKSVSFLPMFDNSQPFPQMPYEKIEHEAWQTAWDAVGELDWDSLYAGEAGEAEGELYCTNDSCEVRQ